MAEIRMFTPGQEEEAMSWIRETLPDFHKFLLTLPEPVEGVKSVKLWVMDMYFRLKGYTVDLAPSDFVIGVEYKNKEAVTQGKENVNIRFHAPHKPGTTDAFAQQVILELLNRLRG